MIYASKVMWQGDARRWSVVGGAEKFDTVSCDILSQKNSLRVTLLLCITVLSGISYVL